MGDPRGAEVAEPMVVHAIKEVTELMIEVEEQMVAPVIDMEEDLTALFGEDDDFEDDDYEGFDEEEGLGGERGVADGFCHTTSDATPGLPIPPSVIEDLSTYLGNLEYGHGQLMKKVIQVSDAEVAAGISIGEIGPRVFAIEGHIQVMASQIVDAVDRLEQIGTQVEQGQQTATQRDEVIAELTQQV
ncbi:hypothetical protein Tco_1424078 [Tanacetum coccineum]